MITLIWAMDRNRLIGNRGQLPWPHIAADMRWFRQQTMGKPVIMGRATFDSIGKPLPGRRNIVLSRQNTAITGIEVIHDLTTLRTLMQEDPKKEWMVIGGATLYAQLLAHADRLLYTEIDHTFEGDTYFPPFDESAWHATVLHEIEAGDASPYRLRFIRAERNPA